MNNKTIIITGGTGSFGNEFTNLLLKKYKPKKIIIYSRDEFKQHNMQKKFSHPSLRFFIGDVGIYPFRVCYEECRFCCPCSRIKTSSNS